jgi:hypothetical protein
MKRHFADGFPAYQPVPPEENGAYTQHPPLGAG